MSFNSKILESHDAALVEIDRLRAELKSWQDSFTALSTELDAAREALEDAIQHCDYCHGSGLSLASTPSRDIACATCEKWRQALAAISQPINIHPGSDTTDAGCNEIKP